MSFLGKLYKFDREEDFDKFIAGIGVTGEAAQRYLSYKPNIKLVKNGDSYTLSSITPEGTKDVTFTSGVTFDEPSRDGLVSKTTFTVDGNTVTEVKNYDSKGTVTFKREFSDSQIVVTATASAWSGTARRYYVA